MEENSQKKILIVEDDLYTRELYQEALSESGKFNVITSVDGEDGLKLARNGGFDLILLDMMMPKIDGITFLTTIKENPPEKPNGPIIVLTNLARDPILNRAIELGATACITKTDQSLEKLISLVQSFIPNQ